MPATGQNSRPIKFAGEKVVVRGRVLEKDGCRAIVIAVVEPAPAGE
jgi:hypothetical protein